VDQLAQSAIFEKLLKSNQTSLPKEKLFLMTCYTSVKSTKNYWGQKVFISRSKQSYTTQFSDLEFFSRFSLTISYLWNFITSCLLGYSLWMSTRSYCKYCRSSWSTYCPKWSSGGFAIRVAISLCEHNSVNPALTQNFLNNSKSVKIWKKLQ
jgi:hypothetical protein